VKDKQMTYYYINAPRLLDYLSRALADETLWDGTVIPREVMHKDALRVSGLKQAGLIEMVDSVAMSGVIHVEDNTSPLATPEHFRTGYCRPINEWEKPPELGQDWSEFHLMSHIQDRSKSIVIVSVDTQREHSFKSLTEAARQLSSEGLLVHVSSISDCLKGRQATFKTTRGKCIVRYS
jgi:hypothetical protein